MTADDIRAAVRDKKYHEALEGISKLLASGKPADYDRIEMLMLRAECFLQLKQNTQALDTLEGIRKMTLQSASKKDEAAAVALSTLIRRSPGGKYTPKTGTDKSPIDIMERTSRDTAFHALWADELANYQQTAKTAGAGTSLSAITTAADQMSALENLEMFVTSATTQSTAVGKTLIEGANRIITSAENAYDQDIARISIDSHKVISTPHTTIDAYGGSRTEYTSAPAGLSAADSKALNDIETNCQKVVELIPTLRTQLNQPDALVHVESNANRLKTRAHAVLGGSADPTRSLPAAAKDTPATPAGRARRMTRFFPPSAISPCPIPTPSRPSSIRKILARLHKRDLHRQQILPVRGPVINLRCARRHSAVQQRQENAGRRHQRRY